MNSLVALNRDLMRIQKMILNGFTSCIEQDLMRIQEMCVLFVKCVFYLSSGFIGF
jgi:hypothetical protein